MISYDGNSVTNFEWWELPAYMEHERCIAAVQFIKEHDTERKDANLRHMRLYGNHNVVGFGSQSSFRTASPDKVTLNVIKAATDTVASKITKNRPRPVFLTSGGNYTLRRKAKLLEKWVDTQFYLAKVPRLSPMMLIDSCVFGTGVMKVFREGPEIKVERVFPGELFVDQAEGLYGEPRSIYQQKYVSKTLLTAMYPKHKLAIAACMPSTEEDFGKDSLADQITVTEAWYLPTAESAGRHVICIDGATLFSEDYTKDYFPFVFHHWSPRLRGFWGMGLAEEIIGIQVEINKLLMKIQKSMHLAANLRVYLETGSKITKAHVNNEIGSVINYSGTPPVFDTPRTVHPEIFSHIENLWQKAFSLAGVAQDAIGGQIPSGLETGQAVREYRDLGTERFAKASRDWEDVHMDLARIMVDLGKDIAEKYPKHKMVAQRDKYTITEVTWKDIDMAHDAYVLKVFPASSLPTSPSGRRAEIAESLAIGLIDLPTAKKLMDFPDIEEEQSLDRAACDHIDNVIELALDQGVESVPEPFDDHALAIKRVTAAYNRAKDDGVPEARLALLRNYITQTAELVTLAQAAMQPQMDPGMAPEPGSPQQPQGF